jgi:hypothetical protein
MAPLFTSITFSLEAVLGVNLRLAMSLFVSRAILESRPKADIIQILFSLGVV